MVLRIFFQQKDQKIDNISLFLSFVTNTLLAVTNTNILDCYMNCVHWQVTVGCFLFTTAMNNFDFVKNKIGTTKVVNVLLMYTDNMSFQSSQRPVSKTLAWCAAYKSLNFPIIYHGHGNSKTHLNSDKHKTVSFLSSSIKVRMIAFLF